MRRCVLLLCTALIALAGCTRPGIDGGGPPGPAAPIGAPESGSPPVAAPPDRDTQIFIAVLRRYLASDTSFPAGSFHVVFVLDHTEPDADDPFRSDTAPTGPAIEAQDAITGALADLVRVEFVHTRENVVKQVDGCAQVRDDGILITLSVPEGAGNSVKVPIYGFVACLGATWLTYVVEHSGSGWEVTGTTGTMGIS
jgi:hypothetical protein